MDFKFEDKLYIRFTPKTASSEESEDDDYGGGGSSGQNVRLNITDQNIQLNNLDIHDIDPPDISLMPDLLFDVEVLE